MVPGIKVSVPPAPVEDSSDSRHDLGEVGDSQPAETIPPAGDKPKEEQEDAGQVEKLSAREKVIRFRRG